MKNIAALFVSTAMAAGLLLAVPACGSSQSVSTQDESEPQAGVISVMEESTQEGVREATGIDLPAPEGASNVVYFVYRLDTPLAEMQFSLDGKEAFLRAQKTDLKAFPYEGEELLNAISEGKNIEGNTDISGMYCSWETFTSQDVKSCEAQCFRCNDAGYIAWIDSQAGVLYNLSMVSGADDAVLVEMAERSFQPS